MLPEVHSLKDRSEQLFDALYNAELCAIVFFDENGVIGRINECGAGILGRTCEELTGRSIIDLTPEEERKDLRAELADLVSEKRKSIKHTHRFCRKDGSEKWITGSMTGYREPDGTARYESVFIDVTAEKQAEEKGKKTREIMYGITNIYDAFYFCDIEKNTFQLFSGSKVRNEFTRIPKQGKLRETLERCCSLGVSAEFQEIFLKFTSPEYVRSTLREEKDFYEFQYKQSENVQSRWKLAEIVAASRGTDDLVNGYCLLITDIDDMKKREFERIQESEKQEALANIALENSGIYAFTYDVPERTLLCPERTCEQFGCRRVYENMPESFREEFIRPDFYDAFNEMFEKCNAGAEKVSLDFIGVSEMHWYRTVLNTVQRDEKGAPLLAVGLIETVDEIHKAQSNAEIMQDICRFAVKSHYETVNLIDAKADTYSFMDIGDKSGERWNGLPKTGKYDETLRGIIDGEDVSEAEHAIVFSLLLENLVPMIEKNGKYSIRYLMRTINGPQWKLIECSFFEHDTTKIIMLITDVQKEEAAKEQLKEAMASAQESNRAKSAFLANMSHEIRTPMNTIIGISEILMNKRLPEDIQNDISMVQNAASGLLTIINDILDFSKIESGKFELTPVDYMLPSLLMDITNMISVRLADRPVYFLMNIDHKLPNQLFGDDIRIKQILMNLLGNAVKFTKRGFIELRVSGEKAGESGYRLTFSVIDSGRGIKKEDIGKLFGTFSQVDTTKNRDETGSGLGLAISKSFSEMMGGGIRVESSYGEGSVFTVEVLQQVKQYEPVGEVRNRKIRMLVCENEEVVISSIDRTLDNLGIEYRVCRDPEQISGCGKMTHLMIRRSRFLRIRDKIDTMFSPSDVFLILENGETASRDYLDYKQLQLPLLCLQIINALNGETIANSYKRSNFDRSQIVPLTYAHVLVVDDNVTNLQVARGLMAPYRMAIDTAASGPGAIELVQHVKYDMVFMDHMMPDMDGVEATRRIRSLSGDYYQKLPIVALTANAVSGAKETFMRGGMNDFLAKPIDMTELNRILKQYVQSKAPAGYLERYSDKTGSSENRQGNTKDNTKDNTKNNTKDKIEDRAGDRPKDKTENKTEDGIKEKTKNKTEGGTKEKAKNKTEGGTKEDLSLEESNAENPETELLTGRIPGVNMGKALETYGGSVSVYHTILQTYHQDMASREQSMEKFFAGKDIASITISAHAIKSASRGIGADAFGELAYELEQSGKNNNWSSVEKQFPHFMQELHRMVENTGDYAETFIPGAKKETEKESRGEFPADVVIKLKESCDNMDFEAAEKGLRELDRYAYPDTEQKMLKAMMGYCADFEYEKLEQIIRGL